MIHKTPWKLGFITMITGEKLESQYARRELGAPTPVLAVQRGAQRKPGGIYVGTTRTPHPCELFERYSFVFLHGVCSKYSRC